MAEPRAAIANHGMLAEGSMDNQQLDCSWTGNLISDFYCVHIIVLLEDTILALNRGCNGYDLPPSII